MRCQRTCSAPLAQRRCVIAVLAAEGDPEHPLPHLFRDRVTGVPSIALIGERSCQALGQGKAAIKCLQQHRAAIAGNRCLVKPGTQGSRVERKLEVGYTGHAGRSLLKLGCRDTNATTKGAPAFPPQARILNLQPVARFPQA